MKKNFLVLTTALIMAFSATFAQDNKAVPNNIATELQQKFGNVNDLQWQTTDNYYKANFTIDGHPMKVFYDFDGSLIGVSRTLTVDQLPMVLIEEVKDKMATNTVTDLFELLTDRGTEYYITYKGDKDSKTYKSTGEYWTRY